MNGLVSSLLLLAGAGGLAYAAALHLRAWRSQCWPSVDGEIVVSRLSQAASVDAATGIAARVRRADIQYRYRVGARRLQGKRICIGQEFYSSSDADAGRYLDRYPPGARVAVYYNPKNPGESCLERRSDGSWLFVALGLAFLAAGQLL